MAPFCTRICPYSFFDATPPGAAPGPPVKAGARVRRFRGCNNARSCCSSLGFGVRRKRRAVQRFARLCQLLLKVLVVARAIIKRWKPGAAEDGSVKVLVVARDIFKRRNQGAAENWRVKVLIEGSCSKS